MESSTNAELEAQKENFLESFESRLSLGADIGIAADFDSNISRQGPSKGLDPRDTFIDPTAKEGLEGIVKSGRDVVIISSRGARDIARIIGIPHAAIVGSLGWETLVDGESRIHPQFLPYRKQISEILGEVRTNMFRDLGFSADVSDEANVEIPTPKGGKIVLQRKGFNEEYPEGINLTWALNMVDPAEREIYLKSLKNYYEEAYRKAAAQMSPEDAEKLAQLCGPMERRGKTDEGFETLDFEVRPISQGSKSKALVQLMRRQGDAKRKVHFDDMPSHDSWIYSGDHAKQDGPVMRAGHLANVLTEQEKSGIGVWSRPLDSDGTLKDADLTVSGVDGNAQLLTKMAEISLKHPVKQ